MKYKFLLITLLYLYSSQLLADGVFNAKITEVGVTFVQPSYAFISISPSESVSTCGRNNQLRFELNSEASKAALDLALFAQIQNKTIKVFVKDNDCIGDSPRPSNISIID